ncbi:MAG TPA: hypothetical protein VF723_06660 [Pyrinomonadaceae bacterium]|jgi:hypothetical protein
MRILRATLVVFLLVGGCAAQASQALTDAPGVTVVKSSWRREVRNPALDEDPLRVGQEQAELERARHEVIQQNIIRAQRNLELLPLPVAASSRRASAPLYVEYVYEATISNTGPKTIRALTWEQVLFDPLNGNQVGQRRFTSELRLRPGKSRNLVEHSLSPPTHIVDATKAGKGDKGQYAERVVIYRIEYEDGSVWERSSK